jgi:glucose/arabinose dehydrogenase
MKVFTEFKVSRPVLTLAGLWVFGFSAAFAQTDPPSSQYRTTVLTRNLVNPTSLAFLPDGRIYITRKGGSIRLINPATGDTSVAAVLPAANLREDGLHALVLDPAFASNKWVYTFFSEIVSGDTSNVVARYTVDSASGALLTATRKTLLKVRYTMNTGTAEHNTGTLAFGPEGNLYVGLPDNTQNIFSGTGAGYAPRDTTRPLYDAQRSAANTNDLRGKILRIRPEADGTYSIPAGNLRDSISRPSFNPTWKAGVDDLAKVRPEVYVMGLRHPFRITVDPQTGWLYWAEPGPNASSDAAAQGPRGYDIVGMAKGPGNYGWPYCRGNPAVLAKPSGVTTPYFCYTHYNYSGSGTGGAMFNPDSLRNVSPNNTGIVNLPPMRPAQVWYAYNSTTPSNFPFAMFGNGSSNAAMLGPIYRYNGASTSAGRLPINFDRHVFIIEWNRSLVFVGKVDSVGGIQNIRSFWSTRDSTSNGPIDMKIGPDGALYLLNWVGSTYHDNSRNGTLTRLEFTGVQTAIDPRATARAPDHSGALSVFGPLARFRLPAGSNTADFYSMSGRRLWTYHRPDATSEAFIPVPAQVHGLVRVRVLAR